MLGDILSLDLGSRTGVAIGPPGAPTSSTVVLKTSGESQAVAFERLLEWLDTHLRPKGVVLVFKEQMLPLAGYKNLASAEAGVRLHAGLHAIVEGMCVRYRVPWEERADSTIRKHFVGRGREGTRAETKAAVIARCHQLGLMPKDCFDDNRADSLAGHDFASATFFRKTPKALVLFGQQGATP